MLDASTADLPAMACLDAATVARGGEAYNGAPPKAANDLRRMCTICGEQEAAEKLTVCRHCLYAA